MIINRKGRNFKILVYFLVINFLVEIISPSMAFALRTGPGQPESTSFEPAGTTQMVDLFSGDFTYNIPLFELPGPDGGYPFNLSYHSGITMDQEASWVGLGWNINPGAINRQVRGLPDEFKGDAVQVKQDMKAMHNFGINAGGSVELFGGDLLKASMGLSLYYNNYRGFGFSQSIGANATPDGKDGSSGGLGLSFDSQNGVGGKLSLGYAQTDASLGFNSERGAESTFSVGRLSSSILGSPTYTYSPSVGMEYSTIPLSVSFRTGAGVGAWGLGYVGGFYNIQKLKKKNYESKAYGYFYLEDEGKPSNSLLDFNREKQTLIHEKIPNLPIPILTADFYNISGQGTGGMFRAWRSDYGSVYDPKAKSSVNGGSIGVDLGLPHLGIAGTYTHGKSESGQWVKNNDLLGYFKYEDQKTDYYEPAYFKIYGETTSVNEKRYSEIGGDKAIKPVLESAGGSGKYKVKAAFVDENGSSVSTISKKATYPAVDNYIGSRARSVRGKNIEQIQNEWLLDASGEEVLSEFDIKYFSSIDPDNYLDNPSELTRSGANYKPHHFGGMTVVNENGKRYVYGLPAINSKQVEAIFSVDENSTSCQDTTAMVANGNEPDYKISGTDEYLQHTETPPYAHSYLLTSVLGSDYVDVNDNGPDEADYGYWVKFTYARAHQNYKWRSPYIEAGYNMGVKSKYRDNKGYYNYGEKEIWYLATAETKSHIAIFSLDQTPRTDALGASGEMATTYGTQSLYRLKNIKLYTRPEYNKAKASPSGYAAAVPIQTINFGYDYSLCNNILNGTSGKLTLKDVGFYYQNSKRGLLNQYEFDYSTVNPSYSQYQYDRWGGYNESTNKCKNLDLPYVSQFKTEENQDSVRKYEFQQIRNSSAQAWHLVGITTPTGSKINIEYESDDYAYVQHREATQMFYIDGLQNGPNELYDNNASPTGNETRIYVKLEDPIPVNVNNAKQHFYDHYLKGLERRKGNSTYVQIYFKNYTNLRDNIWEYVSGYANLKSDGYGVVSQNTANIDIEGDGTSNLVTCYTHGYIDLDAYKDSKSSKEYHPMAAMAWQKMRADHPELLITGGKIDESPGSADYDKAMKVKSLINAIPQITKLFKGYLKYCYDKGWAEIIDPDKSVVRLCSPDQKKYGGGVRVKKVTISDEFKIDGTVDVYGHVYDYVTTNENGEIISSGVASYEPMKGGEENPLRYAKTFTDDQAFQSNNQLYFEYPINESYYPSPSVGYSKVAVRSLATEMVLNGSLDPQVGITGETVHEFYTAKDFPTMSSETSIEKKPYHLWIPVPLIGLISNDKLTATQGYVVEVNDMHGKEKSITYYGAGKESIMKDFPVSRVEYHYRSKKKSYDGRIVNELLNDAFNPTDDESNDDLGVNYEFFVDHISSKSSQITGGADGNTEIPLIPLIYIWPSYSESKTELKTMVFNKVIHRSGILEETVATDGQSTVNTRNIGYDPYTGEPFLTKTVNEYGKDIFTVSSKISSNYRGANNGGNYLGGEIREHLYTPQASSPFFGALFDFNFEKLDTTKHVNPELATGGNGNFFPDTDFYSFIDSEFDNYYHFGGEQDQSFITPGTVLAFKDQNNNLYKGTIIIVASFEVDNLKGRVLALYSKDAIPTGVNLKAFILKPAQENAISITNFQARSFSHPTLDINQDPIDIPGIPNNQSGYVDSVISASQIVQYIEGKDHAKIIAPNPYQSGELGVLRPEKTYVYDANRKSSGPDLSTDGIFKDALGGYHFYYPGWTSVGPYYDINNHPFWTLANEVSRYDQYGHAIESKNALGVYSSSNYVLYGSSMSWQAANAKHEESYFIDFEDSEFALSTINNLEVSVTQGGHTGFNSIEVTGVTEYKVGIKPMDEKEYFISAWIMADEETHDYGVSVDDNSRGIQIKFYDADYTVNRGISSLIKPVGPIIDGWQKVEGTFKVSSTTTDTVESISILVYPGINVTSATIKLDDLRIIPNEANMTAYVYDPSTYRLTAVLDENNYASLYYYDEEGKLFLVKKETENGIYTVQETRSYK